MRLWSGGERPRQETRHWDEANGRTTPGRSKEDADDYRYFQDPDLVPLAPSPDAVAAIDAALPVLPAARRAALVAAGGGAVSAADAAVLVERDQDGLVRAAVAAGAEPGLSATRVCNDLAIDGWSKVTPERLAELIDMESAGRLTATQAKQVLAEMAEAGEAPAAIVERRGFRTMAGDDLSATVERVIVENPDEWARYCSGDDAERKKLAGFFIGQVMRSTRGRADGAAVNRLLQQRAGEPPPR